MKETYIKMDSYANIPKSLKNTNVCEYLQSRLNEKHMRPLTKYVKHLKKTINRKRIPYFDPWDGGVNAPCLFLFETPGPKAIRTRFVSRNNPDDSAKNFFVLCNKVKINRKNTIS